MMAGSRFAKLDVAHRRFCRPTLAGGQVRVERHPKYRHRPSRLLEHFAHCRCGQVDVASGTTSVTARHTQSGYLGGLGHTTKKRALPIVTLKATTGVASLFIEGTDVPAGNATSCISLTTIVLTLPGFKKPYHFITKFPGCSTPQVHPIVKGPTGQMA